MSRRSRRQRTAGYDEAEALLALLDAEEEGEDG